MKNLRKRIAAILRNRQKTILAVAGSLAAMVGGVAPIRADSFSITTDGLLSNAATLFNALWPVFAIVAGLGLGIAIVRYVVNAVREAFS